MSNSMAQSEASIECFENYTASQVFIQGLGGLVNFGDVEVMIRAQKQMLQRFEKTNECLVGCNALSASRLKSSQEDFKKMTKMLLEMKKDLDYVFRKVRSIRAKLSTQYPTAFEDAQRKWVNIHDENEEEDGEEGEEVLQVEISDEHEIPKLSVERRQASKDKTSIQYMKMEERNDSSE